MKTLVILALAGTALGDLVPFVGHKDTERPAFEAYYGQLVPLEDFESIPVNAPVGDIPALDAFFAPENAVGDPLPLPIVVGNSPVSIPHWMGNFDNGRPAWSPWVIRPDEGKSIYAFGQVNSQGDWVRIDAFDADDQLVASFDSLPLPQTFAGFVSKVPIARVVITPLGNNDGLNGMDDVQVGIDPPACTADVNCDGSLDILDFVEFQQRFLAADPVADCDGNGQFNILDFVCFQAAFLAGCG